MVKKIYHHRDRDELIENRRFDIVYNDLGDYYPKWEENNYIMWHDFWKYEVDTGHYMYIVDNLNTMWSEDMDQCESGPTDICKYLTDLFNIFLLPIICFFFGLNAMGFLIIVTTWLILFADEIEDDERVEDEGTVNDYMYVQDWYSRHFKFYKLGVKAGENMRFCFWTGPPLFTRDIGYNPWGYMPDFRTWYELNIRWSEDIQNSYPVKMNISEFLSDGDYLNKSNLLIDKPVGKLDIVALYNNKNIIKRLNSLDKINGNLLNNHNFIKPLNRLDEIDDNIYLKNLSYYDFSNFNILLKNLSFENYNLFYNYKDKEIINFLDNFYISEFRGLQNTEGVRDISLNFYINFLTSIYLYEYHVTEEIKEVKRIQGWGI